VNLTKIILIIVLIILGATFCTLNREEISLRYFFGWNTSSFPLFLLILASLFAGMVLGFSVGWRERRKLRAQARDLRERVKALREEVETPTPMQKSSGLSPETPKVGKPPLA
jgi:uncharacterized integral membrane protein